jgi:hypothetical protein
MAYQCLKLVLCYDQHHAEAYNNLGVLFEIKKKIFYSIYFILIILKDFGNKKREYRQRKI